MRFIVDAQLPLRVVDHLNAAGHGAMHVKQLPGGVAATDAAIARFADQSDRIVMTKDVDLADSHLLR